MRLATAAGLAALLTAPAARAAPQPLSDDALREVNGAGVSIAVHLELSSSLLGGTPTDARVVVGFNNGGSKTYAIVHNLAGVADLLAVTFNTRTRTDGSDYLDIGLPGYVGFTQFGFRALSVGTDPNAAISPASSYGSLLLNGVGSLQGHAYLWAK